MNVPVTYLSYQKQSNQAFYFFHKSKWESIIDHRAKISIHGRTRCCQVFYLIFLKWSTVNDFEWVYSVEVIVRRHGLAIVHHVQRHGDREGVRGHRTPADRLPETAQHDLREARWGPPLHRSTRVKLFRAHFSLIDPSTVVVVSVLCVRNRRNMFTKMGVGVICVYLCVCV